MLKNIAALIKVKTIVTFAVVAVWCYLAVTGNIDTDYINNVVLMVVSLVIRLLWNMYYSLMVLLII